MPYGPVDNGFFRDKLIDNMSSVEIRLALVGRMFLQAHYAIGNFGLLVG